MQSLVENAGSDVYRALTAFVRRRRSGKQSEIESAQPADPERILLGDRDSTVHVLIDPGVDEDAVKALQEVDFSHDSLRDVTLCWNPRTKTWDPEPGRRSVDLWLPGDPLDENRGKAS